MQPVRGGTLDFQRDGEPPSSSTFFLPLAVRHGQSVIAKAAMLLDKSSVRFRLDNDIVRPALQEGRESPVPQQVRVNRTGGRSGDQVPWGGGIVRGEGEVVVRGELENGREPRGGRRLAGFPVLGDCKGNEAVAPTSGNEIGIGGGKQRPVKHRGQGECGPQAFVGGYSGGDGGGGDGSLSSLTKGGNNTTTQCNKTYKYSMLFVSLVPSLSPVRPPARFTVFIAPCKVP